MLAASAAILIASHEFNDVYDHFFLLSEVNPSQICLCIIVAIVKDELYAITTVECPVFALMEFLNS